MAVDVDILREALRYDPETGLLYWRERPESHFKTWKAYRNWNAKYPGREAFTSISNYGYRASNVAGVGAVLAHRVIWAIVHGEWPEHDIDHINHDRLDNRLINLRTVTRAENARNRTKAANSRLKRVGVQWNKRLNKWCAVGSINGRQKHLGTFADHSDACARRTQFEREHGYHENHGMALA